jgi:O-methyltransferase
MDDIQDMREEYKKEGFALFQYDNEAVHSFPYDAPWITDKNFSKLYELLKQNTLIDRTRAYSLYLIMEQVNKLSGDILEVGTWRGGTAAIFTSLSPEKKIYLADTFEGVVKSSEWEHYKDKAHSDTSVELVRNFLDSKVKVTNYQILKGVFPEDTGKEIADKKFALVYLDVDVYLSTKDAFNYVWKNIVPGGIVVFDDYGMISACEGISRFVNEIKGDKDKVFTQNINGQAYIIKR